MTQPPRCTELYSNKIVLAPMVRQSNLPFRLLCLEYGADLVYSEELIDYRLSKCRRLDNKVLKTVDFVDEQGDIVLRLDPSEKDRFIVQIGSNNFDRFLRAAKLVADDVAGIDLNFGCPKKFSLAGGMGAAMLEKPEEIEKLLKRSVESLDLPITCKIRILPDLQKTLDLVKMIEGCGVSAIAVHGRTKEQRSLEPCSYVALKAISEVLNIPVIANGASNDLRSYSDILKFKDQTGASSVMIARCAMRNPSIFKSDNSLDPIEQVIKQYLRLAVRYDNLIAQTKYTLQTMLGSGHFGSDILHKFHKATDHKTLCEIFELGDYYEQHKITATKRDFYDTIQTIDERLDEFFKGKQELFSNQGVKEFVIESVPFNQKHFKISPKAQLVNLTNKLDSSGAAHYELFKLEGQKKNEYYCYVIFDKIFYLNRSKTSGKKNAEHATALIVLRKLGLIEGD